jgi:hypothetical protein
VHDEEAEWGSPQMRQAITAMFTVVRTLHSARRRMTHSLASTFIYIASEEGLTVSELAARCGVTGEVMSKHLRDLGTVNRRHRPGFSLVTLVQGPQGAPGGPHASRDRIRSPSHRCGETPAH